MDRDDALDYRMLYGKAVAELERLRATNRCNLVDDGKLLVCKAHAELEELRRIRETCIKVLIIATGESREAIEAEPFRCAHNRVRELARLQAELSDWRQAAGVEANREFLARAEKAEAEIERLRAALSDLVERWSTERGYDGAIQRARSLLMENTLRSPAEVEVRHTLKRERKE